MREHTTHFLNYLSVERAFSPRTVEAYRHDLGKLIDYLESISKSDVLKITKQDVRDFFTARIGIDSPVTQARKLSAIKSFFKYLEGEDIVRVNPASNVRTPKLPENQPAYLTETEYQSLIKTVRRMATPQCLIRDTAIIVLLLGTGIRLSELVGLTLDRVSLEQSGKSITVRGKGNKERIIPLADDVVAVLAAYLKCRPDVASDKLFIGRLGDELHARSVYGLVKLYIEKAGIKKSKAAVHTLRHTFGTSLMNRGINIVVIQQLMGHKNIKTTSRYLHINNVDMRNAVDSLVLNKP